MTEHKAQPAWRNAALVLACWAGGAVAAPALTPAADPVHLSLEPVMVAEFALSEGDLVTAGKQYLYAARRTGDAHVAQNAFRLALLTQNDAAAKQALAIWQRNPVDPDDLQGARAAVALREGRDADAVRELASMLSKDDDRVGKLAMATLATATRDEQQAKRVLRQLIESNAVPNRIGAWLAVGGLAQALDETSLIDAAIAQMLRRFPDEPRITLLRAAQDRLAGNETAARETLRKVEPATRTNASLRSSVALEYRLLGDYLDSERVLAQGEQTAETYTERAYSLAQADDRPRLEALYSELQKTASRPDPQQRLLLGQIAEYLKKWEESLRWYASVPGEEEQWSAQLASANVLFELKRTADWQQMLKALQTNTEVPDDTRRDAFLLEATLFQRAGDPAREQEVLNRAMSAFPDDTSVLYTRALAFERNNEVERAIAEFRRILVMDANNVDTLNALGYTLADRTTRYQEALQLINRARAAQPNNAAIIDSYGWVLYKMGDLPEALRQLQRAARLQRDPEIFAHLAEVLWRSGDRDGARKAIEQADKLDTDKINRAVQAVRQLMGISA
ncbi:tetratricopeptide repeat protein [Luteimonas sp. FXH3W]|uniref:Tetratricopeptide repeat protein n=1 Tax=Aquilutibacter rugosus TaxID=3115820 RepID=A0ABU7UW57_9GAMM